MVGQLTGRVAASFPIAFGIFGLLDFVRDWSLSSACEGLMVAASCAGLCYLTYEAPGLAFRGHCLLGLRGASLFKGSFFAEECYLPWIWPPLCL
eukprot:c22800_g2_i3 orf=89-370(-)